MMMILLEELDKEEKGKRPNPDDKCKSGEESKKICYDGGNFEILRMMREEKTQSRQKNANF